MLFLTKKLVFEIFRFGLVGVFNTALYAVIFSFVAQKLSLHHTASHLIAYFSCIPVAFWVYSNFVFPRIGKTKLKKPFFKFLLTHASICIVSTGFSLFISGMSFVLNLVLMVGLIPALSFIFMKLYVFKYST